MEIKIKTNYAILESNGWKKTYEYEDGGFYKKWVNNKLLKVVYDNEFGCITHWDILDIKCNTSNPDDCEIYLKDMPALLEELKKLEVN